MFRTFALFAATLAVVAPTAPARAQTAEATAPPDDNGTLPAGGRFKECHGYVRHVSAVNIKVHCIDGNPSDQSFLATPKHVNLRNGTTMETRELAPETPVHVFYTQSLGIKKAYKIYVADPDGRGLYGFRT
jgi:hypothetical protein